MTTLVQRQQCVDFGRRLLQTGDLDPVYIAIYRSKPNDALLARLVVAYWCLYHLGASAALAERHRTPKAFWQGLLEAATNTHHNWPRGAERRHWRGSQAIRSAQDLADTYKSPQHLLDHWAEPETFLGVVTRAKSARGFGDWIAFKVADMLERVCGRPVDFSNCELGFYDEPAKGAGLVMFGEPTRAIPKVLSKVVGTLSSDLHEFKAPPMYDRPVNVQEMETILCKYKSMCGGHYPIGKDIREVHHGLRGWGDFAEELELHSPRIVLRQTSTR